MRTDAEVDRGKSKDKLSPIASWSRLRHRQRTRINYSSDGEFYACYTGGARASFADCIALITRWRSCSGR